MLNRGYMSMNRPAGAASFDRNLAHGYCWLVRSAMLDRSLAQEKLSMMFAQGDKDDHGTVLPVDLAQADVWFRLAARSPFHDNSQIRAMIEPHMTTEQLVQAQRLFEAWQPQTVQQLKTTTILLPVASSGGATPRECPAMK
jgi:TPR repeat protein